MSITCRSIAGALERLAPCETAEAWDNVGLLLGNPDQEVDQVLLSLDVTPAVAQEAIDKKAGMIVSHHPILFQAVKSIRTETAAGALIALLLKHDVAVYAAHTNLDAAVGGVNDALAGLLGLCGVEPLQKNSRPLVKIVTFVPVGHEEAVWQAMSRAGAGHIGRYSHCSFQVRGTGTFLPGEDTQPFIGKPQQLTSVQEIRLETVAPAALAGSVLQAMLAAHPYEEAAYDIYALKNTQEVGGLGRVGNLAVPMPLQEFASFVKTALGVGGVRVVGDPGRSIERVAVCGGAGMELAAQAIRAGAQVLVTGDIRYHDAQNADHQGLALVDAGHFGTEVPVLRPLQSFLEQEFPFATKGCRFSTAARQADIWQFV